MSTRTQNIELEKPTSDENYDISVFNRNSDKIDQEIALRAKTADIQNNLTSTATNKPLSAAQGKALNDGKVNISDIQNNLTSTATDKPLSAAQGKILSDTIVENIGTSIDITNDVKTRTGSTSTCSCYVSKVGNMKLINLNIRVGASYTPNVQASQDNIIAVLPVDYRPVRKCYMTTVAQDGTNYIVSVEANGNFMIYPASITSTFLRVSFPIY